VCEDREGNVWVGTGNGGLAQLRAVNFRVLGPPDQWQGRAVLSIATGHDGAMWIGTEGAGLYRFQDGNWDNFEFSAGISNRYVWSVTPDASGRIWAGTWGGGLFVQDGTRFNGAPGLDDFAEPVAALLASTGGKMWLGTRVGLLQFESGRMTWLGRAPELFSPDVRAVREGPDGAIWFGMAGGGLGCFKQGTLKQFRISDGLSSDFVQCLRFDADGALWIGTLGGGLNRLKDGRFATIGTSRGIPDDAICDIEDDGRSNFWFSSHGGIFRVSKDDLNGCADGVFPQVRCLIYGKGDGLPTLECSGGFQPAGCKTSDGRLWFPTSKGLVVVDPNEVNVNRLQPPVIIEELLVDGQPVALDAAGGGRLRIPAGRNRVEFHYTGLSFVVPEKVRFQYWLEGGLDAGWVNAADGGIKRVAEFNYLRPGDYTFHVRACNNDEVWNEAGVSMSFTLLPHFWQTWWFRAFNGVLAMAAVAGVVWFNLQRRMRRKLERLERQRAIERERERIAKDIHDDLGASLTRITMLSQSAQVNLDNPKAAAANLNRIYGTARELTRAMDEIVWAVNPRHDTLDSLASYLGKFAQDFLHAANVRCRLDVPVQLPAWPLTAEVRHNLFLAVKEALHNVVKHAAATEVRVALAVEPRVFVFTVQDNGNGFVEQQAADLLPDPERIVHGYGLANMRKRLAEIGGRCEIESPPGQGTKVRFTVPVEVQATRSGWRGSDGVS
jgi:signal transduction histidine kinase/streptogramin lyase